MKTIITQALAYTSFSVGFILLFTVYLLPLGVFLMWLPDGGAEKIARLFRKTSKTNL